MKLSKIIMMVLAIFLFISCNTGPKSSEQDQAKDNSEQSSEKETDFKISLAQWSLHNTYLANQ